MEFQRWWVLKSKIFGQKKEGGFRYVLLLSPKSFLTCGDPKAKLKLNLHSILLQRMTEAAIFTISRGRTISYNKIQPLADYQS